MISQNPDGLIHKTDKQLLAEAGARILQFEQEAKEGVEAIEQLKWMVARYRVVIEALGQHFKLSTDDMKAIVQPVFDAKMEAVQKEVDSVKQKFVDDVKAGKMPDFTVVDGEAIPRKGE